MYDQQLKEFAAECMTRIGHQPKTEQPSLHKKHEKSA
jgi:hypothetical protein